MLHNIKHKMKEQPFVLFALKTLMLGFIAWLIAGIITWLVMELYHFYN